MNDRRCVVLLAVQQVLLGEVTPNLRAVTVEYGDTFIRLEAFFDKQPNEEELDGMSLVETELVALFPDDHDIRVELIVSPAPLLIPKDRSWAYHRKEPLLPG